MDMLYHKEGWMLQNWCFWTVALEKTLESPLDCKEIQPVHPKGNQSWIFIGKTDAEAETAILWPPNEKWLTWKAPNAGKDWRQEERGTIEDEMVGWHHWLNGHEFGQALGDNEGQGSRQVTVHGVTNSQTQLSNWTTASPYTMIRRRWVSYFHYILSDALITFWVWFGPLKNGRNQAYVHFKKIFKTSGFFNR